MRWQVAYAACFFVDGVFFRWTRIIGGWGADDSRQMSFIDLSASSNCSMRLSLIIVILSLAIIVSPFTKTIL